jgi:hypothetical protein
MKAGLNTLTAGREGHGLQGIGEGKKAGIDRAAAVALM